MRGEPDVVERHKGRVVGLHMQDSDIVRRIGLLFRRYVQGIRDAAYQPAEHLPPEKLVKIILVVQSHPPLPA